MSATKGETMSLRALRHVAAAIGADPRLVQGAGGNVSVKSGDTMWIKASGTWLADAEARDIMVPVTLPVDMDGTITAAEWDESGLRPSIETSMHATLPHAVVLHVHAVDAIAHAVRTDALSLLDEKLHGVRWALVPYRRPGLPLTHAILHASQGGEVDVLVLANHGLVVAANSVPAAEALLIEIVERLATPARTLATDAPPALAAMTEGSGFHPATDPAIHTLATDPASLAIATAGVLYPDHVVFLGRAPLVIGRDESLTAALARAAANDHPAPKWVIILGLGIAVADDIARGGEEMLRCLADVAARIPAGAPLTHLNDTDIAELTDWDAEKYRQQLAQAAA